MQKSLSLCMCLCVCLLVFWAAAAPALAKVVEYDLTIAEQEVNLSGQPAMAMTVNGSIPGPVLRFREGDVARIRVHNKMKVDSSIHWHGILLPPGMDGVPNLSFAPIAPGGVFHYEFPIRQSGTYWYHSHTRLQEQRGVYGAIVIQPQGGPAHDAPQEEVIVLSDWTDDDPGAVLRGLRAGREWNALQKGAAQSILGAARAGKLSKYFKRELMRMPAMDLADVAYDRFLANGKPVLNLPAGPGQTLRLRLVDGSATTYFHLQFAGGPLTLVAADGMPVEPVKAERLLIAVAETYDVLVTLPGPGAYELRATSHDGSSYASIWLGSGQHHLVPDIPRPDLYETMGHGGLKEALALTPAGAMGMSDADVDSGRFDQPGMMGMGQDAHSGGHGAAPAMEHQPSASGQAMKHSPPAASAHQGHGQAPTPPAEPGHKMAPQPGQSHGAMAAKAHAAKTHAAKTALPPLPPSGKRFGYDYGFLAADVSGGSALAGEGTAERPWPPYAKLRALGPTTFQKGKPLHTVRLTLDGDMERYVWSFNNRVLAESDDIEIKQGQVVRFILINRTMMHHPIHLHGHFFRVLNGQGDHAPLKHTVDVAPMSTTVIEFDANEKGDWFFHCHLLYHMKGGMARVVRYQGFNAPADVEAIQSRLYGDSWYAWARADVLSNMTQGLVTASNTRHILKASWEVGWQRVEETHWEAIFSYDYYLNRFASLMAGADVLGQEGESEKTRGVFGLHYLLPLNIESRLWIDTDAGGRVALEKPWSLTPRLELVTELEYDTHTQWEAAVGLSYRLSQQVSLMAQWHSEYAWGAGVRMDF